MGHLVHMLFLKVKEAQRLRIQTHVLMSAKHRRKYCVLIQGIKIFT